MKRVTLKWTVAVCVVAAAMIGCGDDSNTGGTGGDGGTGGTGGSMSCATTGETAFNFVPDAASASALQKGAGFAGAIEAGGTDWTAGWTAFSPAADDRSALDVSGCTTVTGEIDGGNWSGCVVLDGIVFVTSGELTIAAGTMIYGNDDSDADALVVTTNATINAVGTASDPIVFGPQPPAGGDGCVRSGNFAGVVLLGNANTNKVDTGNGERDSIEGLISETNSEFGGTDDAHDCGTLQYVRIEYAGFELANNDELNGLTLGGCGSDTTMSYIQVHRGSDDGIEFFGGTATMDHVVISGAQDDSLDFDEGWRGAADTVIIIQLAGSADRGIEADNNGGDPAVTPRTKPTLTQFTMIGQDGGENIGMKLREGVQATMSNFLIQGFGAQVMDIDDRDGDDNIYPMGQRTSESWGTDLVITDSVFANNNRLGDSDESDDNDDDVDETAELAGAAGNSVEAGDLLDTTP